MDSHELKGKVVVITGASSGFGKGAALRFAEAGCSLVLAARRQQLLDELAADCEDWGVDALPVETDVSRNEQVELLAEAAALQFGRIDVWVNDAGVGAIGRFEEVPLADHAQVIATDLLGTVYGSYFAMRQFREQGEGTLINVSSVLGKIPAPYQSSYAAAKHGIVGLDGALRQELRENGVQNIHVCTVLPMAMDTPFFDHAANYTGHKAVPIPPLYDPQDTIDAIVRLATHPQDEVIVGARGRVATTVHGIAPALAENMLGKQTHKLQMEEAPPAPTTVGSVHRPVSFGTGVTGGRLVSG